MSFQSIRSLRAKYPNGLLIQIRCVNNDGTEIGFEGLDADGSMVNMILASARESQVTVERRLKG